MADFEIEDAELTEDESEEDGKQGLELEMKKSTSKRYG